MKFKITDAVCNAVTSHAEKDGEEHVPGGKSLTLQAQVAPKTLAELSPKLAEMFFEDEIPVVPELGWIAWEPEYENAVFTIKAADADEDVEPMLFTKAGVKKIFFRLRAGFLADLKCTVKVSANTEQNGQLDMLLRQAVEFTIKKATQVRIDEKTDEAKPSEAANDPNQPQLPGTEGGAPSDPTEAIAGAMANVPENLTPLIPAAAGGE
jgi:hypothetical protein